jgi:type II secretory ATPase GspE/PulE/Tfp pilus assembly ATPase PilB-like protein
LIVAQVPDTGLYVDPIKVGVVLALLFGWAAIAQWIDRDTNVVKTRREHWNMIVLSGGLVAFFVLLILPWSNQLFVLGIAIWLLIAGAPMMGYLVHRNGRVVPGQRVMTPGHFKRLLGKGERRAASASGLRVNVYDHDGKFVEPPDDPEGAKDFDAVQDFFFDLLQKRASEVDMIAAKEKCRVIYKIDGVATEDPEGLALEKGERVFRMLKKAAGLNVEEIRRPQSGRIKAALLSHEGEPGFTTVQTSGTTQGERMRLQMQSGPVIKRLNELGLPAARLEAVQKILGKQTGVFILSAPPEHGLTTTQYAILKSHDAYINNIHSIERKPLLDLDNVTQQLFERDNTDLHYARVLQTVLRREPDIVLIDQCEDRETAQIATRAASEDRKIYLGMIARDCFDALQRYLTWADDRAMIGKSLLGVMNQRLIRLLCTDCREAFRPDPGTLKKLNLPAEKIERFYRPPTEQKTDRRGRPVVCQNCQGTGYFGRTGVFELMVVDEQVAKLITDGAPVERIKAQCRKNKMYYLQEEGLLKVIDGTTSMQEILRCLKGNDEKR